MVSKGRMSREGGDRMYDVRWRKRERKHGGGGGGGGSRMIPHGP